MYYYELIFVLFMGGGGGELVNYCSGCDPSEFIFFVKMTSIHKSSFRWCIER